MTFEAKAAAMSREELIAQLIDLKKSHDELTQRVAWFERQLFGSKSERRIVDEEGRQLSLGEVRRAEGQETPTIEVPAHRRRKRKAKDPEDKEGGKGYGTFHRCL